jgi:hypothetical protein
MSKSPHRNNSKVVHPLDRMVFTVPDLKVAVDYFTKAPSTAPSA